MSLLSAPSDPLHRLRVLSTHPLLFGDVQYPNVSSFTKIFALTNVAAKIFVTHADGFVTSPCGKHTVGHAVFDTLRYEHTIQAVCEHQYPDCRYTRNDAPAISMSASTSGCASTNADDKRGLDALAPGGILFLHAQKGFGKSKAIRWLASTKFVGKSIVHINFSRSLAYFSTAQRSQFHPVTNYDTVADGPLTSHHLEVVVNSLPRVRRRYDVVVIDEITSVVASVAGGLVSDTQRVAIVAALRRLLTRATYVVLADAVLNVHAVEFVRALAGGLARPFSVVDYTHRPQRDHVCVIHRHFAEWRAFMNRDVRAGKRVVVACMTAAITRTLHDEFMAAFPDKAVLAYYDAPGSNDTCAAMADISVWATADVLLYSPVITAGCSFEAPHFHALYFFGLASEYTGSVESGLQMSSRVRVLLDRVVHCFIRDATAGNPCNAHHGATDDTVPAPYASIADRSVAASDGVLTMQRALGCLHAFQRHVMHTKLLAFSRTFYQHKVDAGFRIAYTAPPPPLPPPLVALLSATTTSSSRLVETPPVITTMSDVERAIEAAVLYPVMDTHLPVVHVATERAAFLDMLEAVPVCPGTLVAWTRLMVILYIRLLHVPGVTVAAARPADTRALKFVSPDARLDYLRTAAVATDPTSVLSSPPTCRTFDALFPVTAPAAWVLATGTVLAHANSRRCFDPAAVVFPFSSEEHVGVCARLVERVATSVVHWLATKFTRVARTRVAIDTTPHGFAVVVTTRKSTSTSKTRTKSLRMSKSGVESTLTSLRMSKSGVVESTPTSKSTPTSLPKSGAESTLTSTSLPLPMSKSGAECKSQAKIIENQCVHVCGVALNTDGLKDDFLHLFRQASLASTPPTAITCFYMDTGKGYSTPFRLTRAEAAQLVAITETATAVNDDRRRVGVLTVAQCGGSLIHASFAVPYTNAVRAFASRSELCSFLAHESGEHVILGFNVVDELVELGLDMGATLRIVDLGFMVRCLMLRQRQRQRQRDNEDEDDGDDDEEDVVRSAITCQQNVMGLGKFYPQTSPWPATTGAAPTPSLKSDAEMTMAAHRRLVDAFLDVKYSKGVAYLLDAGAVVALQSGDALCIGDCLYVQKHDTVA